MDPEDATAEDEDEDGGPDDDLLHVLLTAL